MSSKGKVIGLIIGGLVVAGGVIGAVVVFSNMQGSGSNSNPPQTQLATVQNIEYDQIENLLTWDDVINANSYNVSVNGKKLVLKTISTLLHLQIKLQSLKFKRMTQQIHILCQNGQNHS